MQHVPHPAALDGSPLNQDCGRQASGRLDTPSFSCSHRENTCQCLWIHISAKAAFVRERRFLILEFLLFSDAHCTAPAPFCLGHSAYQCKLLGVLKTYRMRRESQHSIGGGYSALCIQLREAQVFFHCFTMVLKKCSLEIVTPKSWLVWFMYLLFLCMFSLGFTCFISHIFKPACSKFSARNMHYAAFPCPLSWSRLAGLFHSPQSRK